MADLFIENLFKRHSRAATSAVDGLALHISHGEYLALVGPSGCGKTSTLRLIAGLDRPDSGIIRHGDRLLNDLPPHERNVAMVFQDHHLYPHLTVARNLGFPLKTRGVAKHEIDGRVRETARLLQLTDLLHRTPGSLSGGERQRAALGRAVITRPSILLLDEPLSSVDAALRHQLRQLLQDLHRTLGFTVIHVTHDREEAMILGRRVAVMNRGRIVQVHVPQTIYSRPADRFVASFFGSPPMNFIRGRLHPTLGLLTLHVASGAEIPLARDTDLAASSLFRYAESSQEAVVGVRPEDVAIVEAIGSHAADSFPAKIVSVDQLGDRAILRAAVTNGPTVTLAVHRSSLPQISNEVRLRINPAAVHLFTPDESGRRLN